METEKSVDQIAAELVKKWKARHRQGSHGGTANLPVITLSMEPGSCGSTIAERIAAELGVDLFNRDIVHRIANSTRSSAVLIDSLEKERMSGVEDFISSIIKDQYLHPDIYLEHLMKVVNTIGQYKHAVIVGRGANFILPAHKCFWIRVIANLEDRVANVAAHFGVGSNEAKRRVLHRESRREAFVRQSFHADISDPHHYHLILNTSFTTLDAAVETAIGGIIAFAGGTSS
jgi:cytidylate kinase